MVDDQLTDQNSADAKRELIRQQARNILAHQEKIRPKIHKTLHTKGLY